VWVPTDFHRTLFAANGVLQSKLRVVEEPVDTDTFDPEKHAPFELPVDEATFVFLSVFKWEKRKVRASLAVILNTCVLYMRLRCLFCIYTPA
jgi:hypothetical protein